MRKIDFTKLKLPKPNTTEDALTLALVLAITAPDEQGSSDATAIAQDLSKTLSEIEVARCRNRVIQILEAA
jgi:hypothetical protein